MVMVVWLILPLISPGTTNGYGSNLSKSMDPQNGDFAYMYIDACTVIPLEFGQRGIINSYYISCTSQ